jgi:hypothetical protein
MYLAAIDFDPGMHGHFLEYVCNRYIFNIITPTPFFKNGAAHAINSDLGYQKNKKICSGHYTYPSFGNFDRLPDINKIIYIKQNKKFDVVLQINIFYRCFGAEGNLIEFESTDIVKSHFYLINKNQGSDKQSVRRGDLFDKFLNSAEQIPDHSDKCVFEFDFEKFFNFTEFLVELQNLSKFLDHTFTPTVDLVHDWQQFIDKNQGYQTYVLAHHLMSQILSNQSFEIPDDIFLHAYLNVILSKTVRLFSGPLHDSEIYPTNTQEIYQIVKQHLDDFDKNF